MSAAPAAYEGLDPRTDGVIAQRRLRRVGRLAARERLPLLVYLTVFLAGTAALLLTVDSPRHLSIPAFVLYVGLYAGVTYVEFEIGASAAIPTQLVLVPMIFVLPLDAVPLAVAAATLLRASLDVARGRRRIGRLPVVLVNALYVLAPVTILAALGPRPDGELAWSAAPVYLLALLGQFTLDFAVLQTWARWNKLAPSPFREQSLNYAVDTALAPIGLMVAFAAADRPYLVVLVLPLVGLLSLFARERGQRIDAALELGHAYRGTALLLGDVVEADDAYTGEHSRDVVSLTVQVCDELGLDARQRRTAEFTALLHDVGKIRIPAEIINKPGPLDADERRIIETHTVEGEAMLARIGGLLGEVGSIVRSCHERWDGGGYPDGHAAEKIPLIARIVCCTDAFSAMTTDRPYRAARTAAEAVAELRACAGTHFDPRVVDAVAAVVAD